MCGFAGVLRFDQTRVKYETLGAMMAQLESRGPDDEGVFLKDQIGLGHRRLKIIDLSGRSHQPLKDDQLEMAIVYNGAIYNYRELRETLRNKGYDFFSDGDTEVILKGFHCWGADVVDRLQGMFAFAIWDIRKQRLFAARDRLGIKPFYFQRNGHAFHFASTPQALMATGEVSRALDPTALHHYLSWHSVVPAPGTVLKDIRKLPPATTMTIDREGLMHQEQYWQPVYNPGEDDLARGQKDWEDLVLEGLNTAVTRRMVADVPVGVLLSGGLDSSLVVGLLAENGQKDLKTFSIGFEAIDGEAGDEFQYSDLVAKRFNTDHNRIFISNQNALDNLKACIQSMSEPMVSHDNIGFYLLSREVAKHVKVVQSGQGADEVFGGYFWYPPLSDSVDPARDYAQVFFDRDHAEMAKVLQPEFMADDVSRRFMEAHFAQSGADDPVAKALRLDTHIMLVDDPVKRVDSQTMAWGLEARVPFLDHELVELAARMPSKWKVQGGGKYILKEVGRRVLPSAVIDRPKGYFPVPILKYLKGPFLALVKDLLESRACRERGVYQQDYVQMLLADPSRHLTSLKGSKLWQLALLELWLQTHVDP